MRTIRISGGPSRTEVRIETSEGVDITNHVLGIELVSLPGETRLLTAKLYCHVKLDLSTDVTVEELTRLGSQP